MCQLHVQIFSFHSTFLWGDRICCVSLLNRKDSPYFFGSVGGFCLKMAGNGAFSGLDMVEGRDDLSYGEVHVLAVDDSHVDRKVIERLLKITSCKVTSLDSGTRALQFLGLDREESSVGFDGLKVDLIITDYCMPGMTGYELLKKIKGSSIFREIPVVIVSSENILARIDRCLEEGAEDFIIKPVKLADVKRLKSCMFGEGRIQRQDQVLKGRKLEQNSDALLSESPLSSPFQDDCSISHSPPSTSPPCSPRSFSSSPPSTTGQFTASNVNRDDQDIQSP